VGFVALGACGSAGGAVNQLTSTPAPQAEPTIEENRYFFPARGYEALIPEGWQSDANSLVAGSLKVDSFYASGEVDGVQGNISVTCEENPSGVSTEQYVQNRLATLRQLAVADLKTLGTVTVGGAQGQMVSYTLTRGDTIVRKIDVMVTASKCAWTLALATAPSEESYNRDVFDRFLESFRLIDESPATSGS